MLKRYKSVHPVGETLPDSTQIYQVKVVSEFLKAGIPLSKIDNLRGAGGYSLSHSTHLCQLIPFILDQELDNLKHLISGKPILIIFDGTTHCQSICGCGSVC